MKADITIAVHPFDATYRQQLGTSLVLFFFDCACVPAYLCLLCAAEQASADGLSAAILTVIAFIFIPASYAIFVVREREIKAKHLQTISGVSGFAYWISAYAWDMANYLVPFGAGKCFCVF